MRSYEIIFNFLWLVWKSISHNQEFEIMEVVLVSRSLDELIDFFDCCFDYTTFKLDENSIN